MGMGIRVGRPCQWRCCNGVLRLAQGSTGNDGLSREHRCDRSNRCANVLRVVEETGAVLTATGTVRRLAGTSTAASYRPSDFWRSEVGNFSQAPKTMNAIGRIVGNT